MINHDIKKVNRYAVQPLFYPVVVRYYQFYPYPMELFQWRLVNHTIIPVLANKHYRLLGDMGKSTTRVW